MTPSEDESLCPYGHPECDGTPMMCLTRETEALGLYDDDVSRRITDDINEHPEEAKRLRRSVQQARKGKIMPWRDADDDD